MRCHSFSGQPSGLYVSENEWRRHNSEMEPQGRGSRSPLHTRRRNGELGPSKTTRESRVNVQSLGLNAEKIFRHRAEGEIFLLTFPFIGPCHTAHRSEIWAIPSLCRATPSATSERLLVLLGSSPIVLSFVASCVSFQLRLLPSTRVTRLHRYFEPLRHPIRPGLSLASCQLIRTAITAGASRVTSGPLCLHAVATTPAGLLEFVRSYNSISFGLPTTRNGSAPALRFSRLAQRSLTLRPARSPSRLATLCTRGFSSFVASTAALIATGWSEPVPGRVYPRCGPTSFHGAHEKRVNRALTTENA